MSTYEHVSLALETAVVLILIGEFWYDAWWNSRDNRRKRMAKRNKPSYEHLNIGEGK